MDPANDIQIGHARLDHDYVGSLAQVQGHFTHRLVRIGRIHLIRLLVSFAKATRRTHRIAKRTIKGRCVLGRVRHDHNVMMLCFVECFADRTYSAIHHVRWCNHRCTGCRLIDRLLAKDLNRCIVVDISVDQETIVTVRGVRIEGHVTDDANRGTELRSDGTRCSANEIIGIEGMITILRFFARGRHREKSDRRDIERSCFFGRLYC